MADEPAAELKCVIVSAGNLNELGTEVNLAIDKGYEPQGDVFTFNHEGTSWVAQRMSHVRHIPHCPDGWKLDVNDRYQMAVGTITSLATASFVLPIIFLKDVVDVQGQRIADALSGWAYAGWIALAISVCSAIVYYYSSAKWVKLAWKRKADIFGHNVEAETVETLLDYSYFLMMAGFVAGFACVIMFMVKFSN